MLLLLTVSNTVFERRDREHLSPQATQLFTSQTVFEDEAERAWLIENMRSTTILIKVDSVLYSINGNYFLKFVNQRKQKLFITSFNDLYEQT